MLALQSYEQASGFSVLTADELYYVNGGSVTFSTVMGVISASLGIVTLGAGMIASAASTPVTGPVGVAATVATWTGVGTVATGLSAAISALME